METAVHEKNIRLSVVNPYYVRNFARSYRDLAKTDKIDVRMLSEYRTRIQEKMPEERIVRSIESHIDFLKAEISE